MYNYGIVRPKLKPKKYSIHINLMLDHFLLCPDSNTFIGWLKSVSYIFHCEIESYEVISSKLMEIGRRLKWEKITDNDVQRIYVMIITHSLITRYYELKMNDIYQILSWLNWDMTIFFESINPFNTMDLGILAGEILDISEKYSKELINIDCTKFKHALLYASIHNDKAMQYYIDHNMKIKQEFLFRLLENRFKKEHNYNIFSA